MHIENNDIFIALLTFMPQPATEVDKSYLNYDNCFAKR